MKLGILQTGTSPDELKPVHGDYDDLFKRLLAGRGFTFETWRVLDGKIPDSVQDADGWLITGSKFGVYEDHPWIAPLEQFLRDAYAAGVPIVGVCFGHQILAQALGGKVEKFPGGWSVGATEYEMADGRKETLMAWHQDQVTVPPNDAKVIGHSDFCANAMLAYGIRALSVQPHPEFTPRFLTDLLDARQAVLPPEVAKGAYRRLDMPLTSEGFADRITAFFKVARNPELLPLLGQNLA
ncbi:type 1 glutamine amidotransferase [Celeribacter sp. SCSIO 80788]|uniref:type 1 glutamine amidotransferase n=1 Tax=Celeribacter sp. SCSIO 80788 TaxID=3117013 RepID=UPI003DA3E80B